jgi:hypothetical protein
MDEYSINYLLNDQGDEFKNHQDLWTALLELLTLHQIHTGKELTMQDLPEINKKNKLFFGTVKSNWTELAKDIFKADLSEVEQGGTVFVASAGDSTPTNTMLTPKFVLNICDVPPSKMLIHSSIKKLSDDISFKHIYNIQESIIDNVDLFIDANMENLREKIINGTRNII